MNRKLSKFEYMLLASSLFMSQVPCDSSYDRQMARLLGRVKKAHDEEVLLLKVKLEARKK